MGLGGDQQFFVMAPVDHTSPFVDRRTVSTPIGAVSG
jgi:hypothetical protein